jgi:hypothetical protein
MSSLIIGRFRMARSRDVLSMKFAAIAAAVMLFAGWAPAAEAHGKGMVHRRWRPEAESISRQAGGMATMPISRLLPRIAKNY